MATGRPSGACTTSRAVARRARFRPTGRSDRRHLTARHFASPQGGTSEGSGSRRPSCPYHAAFGASPLAGYIWALHGTHFRSPKAHDVRALEPHGEAVRAHRQRHHHGRQGRRRRTRSRTRRCAASIQNARAVNMPKDKVEAAIKRASGQDAANYEQVHLRGLRAARRRGARRNRHRQPHAHRGARCAASSPSTAAISPPTAASASCSRRWACSASTRPASTRTTSSST